MIKHKNLKKIVVGLSGGVDSAVTAYLLKQQGHDISGVFMQNWETDNDDPHCHAEQDLSDAQAVCDVLNIPFHVVNFSKTYWNNVFQYCLDEFTTGRTPNPDIWCNREIKFKVFLDHAKQLGADYLATGHYAQIQQNDQSFELLKGMDSQKDQSYFLYTLGQQALKYSLFPIGHLEKSHVRRIAKEANLPNYNKKDSVGICFIGKKRFKTFLNEFLLAQPGLMKTPEGEIIGKHDGLMFYTIGQRQGLQIGGQKGKSETPWYVLDKNITDNTLIVGQGHEHPLLYRQQLTCSNLHWINENNPATPLSVSAKIRYRQPDSPCHLIPVTENHYQVKFEKPQWAITSGQAIVFYQNQSCLGGATID